MPEAETNTIADVAVSNVTRRVLKSFGSEVRSMRADAGMSIAALARAAGLDPTFVGEIETGAANPSIETCERLAIVLGADLPLRLYPTTGPLLRDHLQAAIAELIVRVAHSRWARFAEIAVRRPARGWIDLGLHDPHAATFVASEIHSELRRLEQLIRWGAEKATGLPSWEGWERLAVPPTISRLLVIRDTRTNRAIADEHRRLLRTVFPADPRDALDSLTGTAAWPGAAILWAARDRSRSGSLRLVARP